MNNDGFGFMGAGTSDNRIAGEDLQHNRQNRTADEAPQTHRMVRQSADMGGPMKEHMDHQDMRNMLSMENKRHEDAMKHQEHHMLRHHKRPHDTQYGHDNHSHHYEDHKE